MTAAETLARQEVLAGPILRGVTSSRIDVWLCLRRPLELNARCFRTSKRGGRIGALVGLGSTTGVVRLGESAFVTLVRIAPRDGNTFPQDEILAYDVGPDVYLR
jgi:hypothetical protein